MKIKLATSNNVEQMVELSDQKRTAYAKVQPQFWCKSINANVSQIEWFHSLLTNPQYLIYVALDNNILVGFIIGQIISSPEVYNPGGFTLSIDDFVVKDERYNDIGKLLLDNISVQAKKCSCVQIIIVTGAHDKAKKQFLNSYETKLVSEWYRKSLI